MKLKKHKKKKSKLLEGQTSSPTSIPPIEPKASQPWQKLTDLTAGMETKLDALFDKLKAASLAMEEVIDRTYEQVHDPKEGEDGEIHLDDVDRDIQQIEKMATTITDVYVVQELANIFGLEKSVKAKVISAFIGRHQYLRPLLPRSSSPREGSVTREIGEPRTKKSERRHPVFPSRGTVRKDGP